MAVETQAALAEIREIEAKWHDYFALVRHQFTGIDFAYLAYLREDGVAQLIAGSLALATAKITGEISGVSGRFRFRRLRLKHSPDDFFAALATVVAGGFEDETLGSALAVAIFTPSANRGQLCFANDCHDRVEMHVESPNVLSDDVLRFDDD
jgi:hypothetical protein